MVGLSDSAVGVGEAAVESSCYESSGPDDPVAWCGAAASVDAVSRDESAVSGEVAACVPGGSSECDEAAEGCSGSCE